MWIKAGLIDFYCEPGPYFKRYGIPHLSAFLRYFLAMEPSFRDKMLEKFRKEKLIYSLPQVTFWQKILVPGDFLH